MNANGSPMQPMPLSLQISENVTLMFTTPLLVRRVPDYGPLNVELAEKVREEWQRDPSVKVSNKEGWQSQSNLWEWSGPAFDRLRHAVHDAVLRITALSTAETSLSKVDVQYRARGWATLNTNGAYNSIHTHGDAHWSVVYYVEMGEEDPGHEFNGRLVLFDPRPLGSTEKRPGFGFGARLVVDPEPGKLIIFPAWLQHWVTPYFGPGERIAIAVNIELTDGRHSGVALW